jgi:hypothetical protein
VASAAISAASTPIPRLAQRERPRADGIAALMTQEPAPLVFAECEIFAVDAVSV